MEEENNNKQNNNHHEHPDMPDQANKPIENLGENHKEEHVTDTARGGKIINAGNVVTIYQDMRPRLTMQELWQRFRVQFLERKAVKLQKILDFTAKHGRVTNDQVEKILHVSDRTATRYLQELAKAGKLQENGKTSSIYYEKA